MVWFEGRLVLYDSRDVLCVFWVRVVQFFEWALTTTESGFIPCCLVVYRLEVVGIHLLGRQFGFCPGDDWSEHLRQEN